MARPKKAGKPAETDKDPAAPVAAPATASVVNESAQAPAVPAGEVVVPASESVTSAVISVPAADAQPVLLGGGPVAAPADGPSAADLALASALLAETSAGASVTCSDAVADVLEERSRQVAVEGYTEERDDLCTDGQLARAAVCYAIPAAGMPSRLTALHWPFNPAMLKPSTRRADLVKAAALLLAEIERIDRAEVVSA